MEIISNLLKKIQPKQELAPPELTKPASGEEAQFGVALQAKKVKDVPVEQLKEVLRLIMVKVGLRAQNWPEDEEKDLLISHIITNYGGHTTKEILLAFEMGMLGKLDVEMNTYENFSCLYFSNVMNAYREWAKDAYRQTIKETPPMIENKENLSDVAMGDWFQDVRKKVIDGMDYALIPGMIYDWLDGQGKINMDTKTKYAYMDKAAQKIEAQGEPPLVEKVKNLAKKMIVNDYILKNG